VLWKLGWAAFVAYLLYCSHFLSQQEDLYIEALNWDARGFYTTMTWFLAIVETLWVLVIVIHAVSTATSTEDANGWD